MSDTVRSYRSESANAPTPSGSLLGGGLRITRFLLVVLLLTGGYAFWISRDTRLVEEFVSANTTFRMVAQNVVENRSRIEQTSVWATLPEQWTSHSLPQLIGTSVNLPEWVQRNLVGRYVFMSGTDFNGFSDTVYITKLSRVGSVLERALRWSVGNDSDPAGGLNIRHLPEYDLFYAIRGRVAMLSSSRRALIETLTLNESERVASEDWDDSIWLLGNEDIRGTVQLEGESFWSDNFSAVGFALRFDQDQGLLKLSMQCTDKFYEEFGASLRNASVPALLRPIEGSFQMSANVGGKSEGMWKNLELLAQNNDQFDALWGEWMTESEPESLASYLAQSLQQAGPGFALTWHGFDMNAIIPAPQFSMGKSVV